MDQASGSGKKGIWYLALLLALPALSCSGSRSFKDIFSQTSPVLSPLVITATDSSSITLAQPVFSVAAKPTGSVEAYIGVEGALTVSGSEVSDYLDVPHDVSSAGYTFTGLDTYRTYTIVVVAQNELGYWVQSITQSTSAIAPVMNDLAVTAVDNASITLGMPTFSLAGNPLPVVTAWIGVSAAITVDGSSETGYTVSNFTDGPVDASSGDVVFTNLSPSTTYKIIVIAKNGLSVFKTITASTAATAPVLNPLTISGYDDVSITLNMPTFSTAGNPLPAVSAWIGVKGTIQLSGSAVSGFSEGPANVATKGYQFKSLTAGTTYTVIVVAQNSGGYDTASIDASTTIVLPVMLPLEVTAFDTTNITIGKPSFSTDGNPLPSVNAWIGIKGVIAETAGVISGADEGPIDVSSQEYQFTGLAPDTEYTVHVIANNAGGYNARLIDQRTAAVAPVLNVPAVTSVETTAITIDKPSFSIAGIPAPWVKAYIGLTGSMIVSGKDVTGYLYGPVDVSAQGTRFSGLTASTQYTIAVVAGNSGGYSAKTAAQKTASIAPVLNPLTVSALTSSSITLDKPSFATAGDPLPSVVAWIGVKGTIALSGSVVTGAISSADVSSSGTTFTGLSTGIIYSIIVVAENVGGYSVQNISLNTTAKAPVMKAISVTATDSSLITIAAPAFASAGNPAPSVTAWIGKQGTISVSGTAVSGADAGPADASAGITFPSLTGSTAYLVVVIASNTEGYDVRTVMQSTGAVPPTLRSLTVASADSTSITIEKPSFAVAGNTLPDVSAYIGLSGTMSVKGQIVSGFIKGPVPAASGDCQFTGLAAGASYTVAVIAKNAAGFDVRTVSQSTASAAPALSPLVIRSAASDSITLERPTFISAGTPVPESEAWIGLEGTISVAGDVVSGALSGPFDVTGGSHQFSGLASPSYRIIVIARSGTSYDVKSITQNLYASGPTLNSLTMSLSPTSSAVILDQPTFSSPGYERPTVTAYIGLSGTISCAGKVVSGSIASKNASESSVMFSGLSQKTAYTVYVVAENTTNYSVKSISKTTLSSDKAITAFSIGGYPCAVADPSITVNIPFRINLDSLASAFTTTGVSVSVAGAVQSGGELHDFNAPVTFTVTAEDGSTKNYIVSATNMGTVSTLSLSTSAAQENEISSPMGMSTDGMSLFIANTGLHTILTIDSPSSSPVITCFAGRQGIAGTLNGALRNEATFTSPRGVGFQGSKLYVADGAADIRRISPNLMKVQTMYSGLPGNPNDVAYDGSYIYAVINGYVYTSYTGTMTKLNATQLGSLSSITYTGGYLFAVDSAYNCVWKITTAGAATLFAGSGSAATYGAADGIGSAARFHHPQRITTDTTNLYVTDGESMIIRKIDLATARVRTIAGANYSPGTSDGTGPAARFSTPEGLAVIGTALYVVDSASGRIRKIE